MRGHFAVAKAIIKILHVQYKVKEPRGRKRFELRRWMPFDGSDDLMKKMMN